MMPMFHRRLLNILLVLVLSAMFVAPAIAEEANVIMKQTSEEQAWGIPVVELEPRLAGIFTFSDFEWISGLSCRVTYNGKEPLPAEVFFTEHDADGSALGPKTRLIYPKLEKGETGHATFRIRSPHPARIVLTADWSGPYKNPY